jgi:hypothetical protein
VICAPAIVGWIVQDPALVRIRPGWPAMQLGSALSLIFLALAAMSVAIDRRRAAFLVLPPLAVGIGTLVESVTGLPLGLEHVVTRFSFLTETLNPKAIAYGTAIAFVFASTAVWLLSRRRQQPTLVAITAGIPLVIGSVALFAHSLAVDTVYVSHPLLQVAFHTATGCTLLSIGLLAHNWRVSTAQKAGLPSWVPLAAGVMLSLVTLVLWMAVRDRENLVRREEAAAAVSALGDAIEQDLSTRVKAYERMALARDARHDRREADVRHAWTDGRSRMSLTSML